jgi:hypothetical protein
MRNTIRPLAALAFVGLITAGCGNAAGSDTPSSTANYDQALKFVTCMRTNGVAAFPDPPASGEITIDGILNGSSIDSDSAVWKRAVAACEDLQPPGFTGTKRTTEQQAAALEFAQCVRENGVKDFPDPTPDSPLVDTNRIPSLSGEHPDLSVLQAAMKTCGVTFGARAGVTKP